MRAGKALLALLLAVLLHPAPLRAVDPRPSAVAHAAARVKDLLPVLFSADPSVVPQAIAPADPKGPTVHPARLDDPQRLERDLRAALREPLSATRLTVTGGAARLGHYSVGSAERITGHVVVLKGDADVHGEINGNLVVLDGDITVHPGARVLGDVLSIGGRVRPLGGVITGSRLELEPAPVAPAPTERATVATARRGAGFFGVFLTLLVLGFGLVTFGRPNLEIVSDTVAHSFGRAFLVGLLGQVLVLPTFGMLIVGLVLTVAGALLAPFAAIVFLLLVIAAILGGLLAVAHAMGETITRRRMAQGVMVSPNAYRYFGTGLAALAVIWLAWIAFGWVPVAGGLIFGAATLGTWFVATVGFGAALLSRGGVREHFAGRLLPAEMMTDEYLWATPQFGVPAVKRPPRVPPA